MTEEQVIEYIEKHGYISDEVKDMAIQALEKQVAIKPKHFTNTFFTKVHYKCECGNEVYKYIKQPYCKWCGKKIDWSEEE